MLDVTRQEENLVAVEKQLKDAVEARDNLARDLQEIEEKFVQVTEDRANLMDQLSREEEMFQEAEDMRARLAAKKTELEEILKDMENRIDEEEERNAQILGEKKKLQVGETSLLDFSIS